jgi:hypothetical protein
MRARGSAGLAIALAACFSKPPRPSAQSDAASDAFDAPGDAGGFNVMFVSSVPYTLSALGGPAGANAACNALAANHLPGNYVAWISTNTSNAIDALSNSRGWIRPDGMPFADSTLDIMNGKMYYPPRIDETGAAVATGTLVATGTTQAGVDSTGGDCGGFRDASAQILYGLADSGAVTWTSEATQSCSMPMHIYCFGTDIMKMLPAPGVPGPRAFVSAPMNIMGGAMAMKTACTTEANTNGISGTFTPLIASSNETALAHVGGIPAQPWVRLDGVSITSDFSTFTAPLDLQTDGKYVQLDVVTGAMMPTIVSPGGSENCSDWSMVASTTDYGLSDRAMYRGFYGGGGRSCASPQPVYCVQTGN